MSCLQVKGYEGLYEVSDQGWIQSIDRTVLGRDGTQYPFKGRVLRASAIKGIGYLGVSLWKDGMGATHYVHRLVALAFIPNPSGLPEVNHKDGNRQHNQAQNLEWVDRLGNINHAIGTGLRIYTHRLTKDEFVDCLFSVIQGESYGSLSTRVPYQVPFLSVKLRKIARELGLEHELDESIQEQRIKRARINGAKNH